MKSIYVLAEEYFYFCKFANPLIAFQKSLSTAVSKYEEKNNVKLIPGPKGSMGQIFFVDGNNDKVVKFTRDRSEAVNSYKIMKTQETDKESPISKNVVSISNVYTVEHNSLPTIYIIEQERGQDIPKEVSDKLMFIIGPNVSKQSDNIIEMIADELNEEKNIKEISEVLSKSLLKGSDVEIVGDASGLGEVLRAVRNNIDKEYKDFRPSNMLVFKENNKYKIKLTDIGYGSKDYQTKLPMFV